MRRVIILPLDGYKNAAMLMSALREMIGSPDLAGLIAYIKLNDGVHNIDMGGPEVVMLIDELLKSSPECEEVEIFLDLKIFDVSATLENVLKKYLNNPPGILTVSSSCSVDGIVKLRRLLPKTKLAMVSMVTDISKEECQARYGMPPEVKIYNDLQNIRNIYGTKVNIEAEDNIEPFDLIVCSAHELEFLQKTLPPTYGYIVPGIRDEWMHKANEHQKRIVGVLMALEMGATYVVMGAQLTKGNPERDITAEMSRFLTKEQIEIFFTVPTALDVLKQCEGYYKSPQDADGKSTGPLVAYAGTYIPDGSTDGSTKNFVGYEYFNVSQAEQDPDARLYLSFLIKQELENSGSLKPDVVIGAPMGGVLLAGDIGRDLECRSIFAEKKVISVAQPSDGQKEKSELVIERHIIYPGDKVMIVEDVCNNFSTTEKLQALIESFGGQLTGILCAFNRSGKHDWQGIPVISAQEIPTQQFKQEDPQVAELVAAGKVIWKPKNEWSELLQAMDNSGTG